MDGSRFDTLVRTLSLAGSRRRVLTALSGALGLALGASSLQEAGAKKKCPVCKRRKNGKCKPKRNGTACGGGKVCQRGKCACPSACCADRDCLPGEACFTGTCVNLQGTCATGADSCLDDEARCGAGGTCLCRTTVENQTRCGGEPLPGTNCNTCTSSAQCAAMFPNAPGAFCAKSTGGRCIPCNGFCSSACSV